MSIGVVGIGRVTQIWQVYAAFLIMGIGWACLSTTAVATTLALWFERYQGRAVSIASLGASAGGMIGVPVLLIGIARIGFAATTTVSGLVALIVLLPPALFVLRHRPQDIGLFPDGVVSDSVVVEASAPAWTRAGALRTCALRSVVATFGIGMMVQIGFLTHQVTLISPSLGASGTSATVSATAIAALFGRLVLVRFADQINERAVTAAVLVLAGAALTLLALLPVPAVLVGGSILFGLTVGNVTTLSPIIVRREFGAASFGAIFGIASCGIQFVTALGPGFYGLLHDAFGGYRVPLLLAAALDVLAGAIVLVGAASRCMGQSASNAQSASKRPRWF
jgi:MFS family permease